MCRSLAADQTDFSGTERLGYTEQICVDVNAKKPNFFVLFCGR